MERVERERSGGGREREWGGEKEGEGGRMREWVERKREKGLGRERERVVGL